MGIVVIVKRDEAGKVACSMEIELPEIKELIGQNGVFEDRLSAFAYQSYVVNGKEPLSPPFDTESGV